MKNENPKYVNRAYLVTVDSLNEHTKYGIGYNKMIK